MKRFILLSAVAAFLSAFGSFPAIAGAEKPGNRIETVLKDEKGNMLKYPSCTITPANGHPVYRIRVAVDGKVIIAKNTSGLLRCRHKENNFKARLLRHTVNHVTMHTLPAPAFDPKKKCQAKCFELLDVPLDASAFPDQFYAAQTPAFYPCMQKCLD